MSDKIKPIKNEWTELKMIGLTYSFKSTVASLYRSPISVYTREISKKSPAVSLSYRIDQRLLMRKRDDGLEHVLNSFLSLNYEYISY